MVTCFVGLLIVLTGLTRPEFDDFQAEVLAAVRGGHVHVYVQMDNYFWPEKPQYTALVQIKRLADCIYPENARAVNDAGASVPFKIEDDEHDGYRQWAMRPLAEFPHFGFTVDIDFINKCQISSIAAGEAA